jgi:Regulator of chromosome condensation (RCC1) repeat
VQADGTAWSWGFNGDGQLGNGNSAVFDTESPVQVAGLASVKTVAASISNGYASRADGTAWMWGADTTGAFGCVDARCFQPQQITGLSGVTKITPGFALLSNGTVKRWSPGTTPVQIANLTLVTAIKNGAALRSDGTVWILPTTGTQPTRVPNLASVTALGDRAVKSDGTVWSFTAAGATRLPNVPPAANIAPAASDRMALIVAR